MQIKLPTANELKIKHLMAFEFLSKVDKLGLENRLKFIELFVQVPYDLLERVEIEQINEIFDAICELGANFKGNDDIKNSITINGKRYIFVERLQSLPAAWFTYAQRLIHDKQLTADKIAAMCYIEENMKYNQRDKNNEIINPIKAREDIFYNDMLAVDYVPLIHFFFRHSAQLVKGLAKQKKKIIRSQRLKLI